MRINPNTVPTEIGVTEFALCEVTTLRSSSNSNNGTRRAGNGGTDYDVQRSGQLTAPSLPSAQPPRQTACESPTSTDSPLRQSNEKLLRILLIENTIARGMISTVKTVPGAPLRPVLAKICAKRGLDLDCFELIYKNGERIPFDATEETLRDYELALRKVPPPPKVVPREMVRLDFYNGDETVSGIYPLKLSGLQVANRFLADVGAERAELSLPRFRERYWLGVKELGFVFSNSDELMEGPLASAALTKFFIVNGMNVALEIGTAATRPAEVLSLAELSRVLCDEVATYELVSDTYGFLLSDCREEVNDARAQFAATLREFAEDTKVTQSDAGDADDVRLTREYVREEIAYVYTESEPPIPENVIEQNMTFNVIYPGDEYQSNCFVFRANAYVSDVIENIYARWVKTSMYSQGIQHNRPERYVLKATGLNEFIVPYNDKLEEMRLCDYDYVRLASRRQNASVELTFIDRSVLHDKSLIAHEKLAEDMFKHDVLNLVLGRDVWREPTDAAAIVNSTDVGDMLRVKMLAVKDIPHVEGMESKTIYFQACLLFGGALVCPPVYSITVLANTFDRTITPPEGRGDGAPVPLMPQQAGQFLASNRSVSELYEWLVFKIPIRDIPRETRLLFTVFISDLPEGVSPTRPGEKDYSVGWVATQLLNHKMRFLSGEHTFKLWDDKPNPIGRTVENTHSKHPSVLYVEIGGTNKVIEFPTAAYFDALPIAVEPGARSFAATSTDDFELFKRVMNREDPLYPLSAREREVIWRYREIVAQKPTGLAKLLRSVKWSDANAVRETHRLLRGWPKLAPYLALELLDAKFADQEVRGYATRCLESLTDAQMQQILLQLVQVLKYEPTHSSPLAKFILRRSLMNRNQIGFSLYWLLRSEMHVPSVRVRYGVLLEAYLRGCGEYRGEFEKQLHVLKPLERIAMLIKDTPKETRLKVLRAELAKLEFPRTGVQLPIDPRFVVNGLVIEKCKYMDSKKLPLWLSFKNVEPMADPILIMFKCGDDLRQDIFTLQLIRIMDGIWKNRGYDLRLSPYRVTATGDQVGMVEVVLNSETTGKIMKSEGSAFSVIREDSITNWLRAANPTPKEWEIARHNFCLSCAGYCVATYILGIGDRHSDNIMVKRTGELFHIDFGHFLGNFKAFHYPFRFHFCTSHSLHFLIK